MNTQDKQKIIEEMQFTKEELKKWHGRKRTSKGYIEIDAKIQKNGKRNTYFMTGFICKDDDEFNALEKAIKEKAFAIQIGEVCGHKHIISLAIDKTEKATAKEIFDEIENFVYNPKTQTWSIKRLEELKKKFLGEEK